MLAYLCRSQSPTPTCNPPRVDSSISSSIPSDTALIPDIVGAQNVPTRPCSYPIPMPLQHFFSKSLVDMADSIKPYLWIAGLRFSKIRPLHRNNVIRREIVIANKRRCTSSRATRSYSSNPYLTVCCSIHFIESMSLEKQSTQRSNASTAFLATYLRLIRHQSDFSIAIQFRLIPSWVTWSSGSPLALIGDSSI